MHIQDPEERRGSRSGSSSSTTSPTATSRSRSSASSTPPRRSRRSCRPSTSARSGSRWRAPSRSSRCSTRCSQAAAEDELDEVVIGMPHRGRLNVLANIVGKPYEKIFAEFEGNIDPETVDGSGDVKYHLGAEAKYTTPDGQRTTTGLADRQPEPPGGRRPGGRGHRPGQAGPDRQGPRGLHRAARADARRRRLRRPGRGRRDAQPVPAARLPHRRHRPRRRQQPGRLHHRAAVRAGPASTAPTSPG